MGRVATLVKYTKGLANFICEKVENGQTVAEICREYPEACPTEKTIYRWKKDYPDFKTQLNEAYETFFYKKIDEMEDLSKAPIPVFHLDAAGDPIMDAEGEPMRLDRAEVNAALNSRRIRIDTLKFILAKLAPKLVRDLRDTPSTAVAVIPSINVINYSAPEKENGK